MHARFNRTTAFLGATILVVGLVGCGQTKLVERKVTLAEPYVANSGLDIATTNGGIVALVSESADIRIAATIHAETAERAEATDISVERGADKTLKIRVVWPDGTALNGEGCDITLVTPGANGVKLVTDNGELKTSGLTGNAELETTNGSIHVDDHHGQVTANTMNGHVAVSGATGSVESNATNGAIDVALAPASPGPVNLGTTNGAIKLSVGPAFAGELVLDTTLGALSVDASVPAKRIEDGEHHIVLKFDAQSHGPTVQSSASTTNGAIEVNMITAEQQVN